MMLVLLLDGERQVRYEISAMMQIIGKNNRKNIKELQDSFFCQQPGTGQCCKRSNGHKVEASDESI